MFIFLFYAISISIQTNREHICKSDDLNPSIHIVYNPCGKQIIHKNKKNNRTWLKSDYSLCTSRESNPQPFGPEPNALSIELKMLNHMQLIRFKNSTIIISAHIFSIRKILALKSLISFLYSSNCP